MANSRAVQLLNVVAREGGSLEAAALIAESVSELLPEIAASYREQLYVPGVAIGAKRLLRALSRGCAASRWCQRVGPESYCPNRKAAIVAACRSLRLDLLRLLIREGGPLCFREFKNAVMGSFETGDNDRAARIRVELRAAVVSDGWQGGAIDERSVEFAIRGALMGGHFDLAERLMAEHPEARGDLRALSPAKALVKICGRGDLELAQRLVDRYDIFYEDLVSNQSLFVAEAAEAKYFPVMRRAIEHDRLAALQWLLNRFADQREEEERCRAENETPYLSMMEDMSKVKCALTARSRPLFSSRGLICTACEAACVYRRENILRWLTRRFACITELHLLGKRIIEDCSAGRTEEALWPQRYASDLDYFDADACFRAAREGYDMHEYRAPVPPPDGKDLGEWLANLGELRSARRKVRISPKRPPAKSTETGIHALRPLARLFAPTLEDERLTALFSSPGMPAFGRTILRDVRKLASEPGDEQRAQEPRELPPRPARQRQNCFRLLAIAALTLAVGVFWLCSSRS
jgi:hypothetical protein